MPPNFNLRILKNLPLALNGVLAIALAALYFLHFNLKGECEAGPTEQLDMAKVDSLSQTLKITYVNTDSIWNNYKLVADKLEVLEDMRVKSERRVVNKTSSLESQIGEMMEELQTKAADFERNGATMNESIQALRLQELQDLELNMRNFQMSAEQEVIELQEKLQTDLIRQETSDTEEIRGKINEYLEEYNATHQFTYILAYAAGGGIMLADDGLDITADVVVELNRRYDLENPPEEETEE